MECGEPPGYMPKLPTCIGIDAEDLQGAGEEDDDDRPTLDVLTRVWKVEVLPISDEVRWSFRSFVDPASPVPVTTSPLPRF